jgi:hypothetical protein
MSDIQVNFDPETQCHFGTISYHSVSGDALDDVFTQGESLTHKACVEQAKSEIRDALKNWVRGTHLDRIVDDTFEAIEDDFNDRYEAEDEQFLYERDGYKISNSPLLVCLFVEKSPYYTYTRHCSPCAPNAGDLDNPINNGLRTYCLGLDWFDQEAPYPVFSVATGLIVPSPNSDTEVRNA